MHRLPDIPALSSAEVVLPTLAMNSSELGDISLSGLINTIITPDNQGHVLDPAMQVTITEMAFTRAFSLLKAPSSAFTFKNLLGHFPKRALTQGN